jgi:hypothetical protein
MVSLIPSFITYQASYGKMEMYVGFYCYRSHTKTVQSKNTYWRYFKFPENILAHAYQNQITGKWGKCHLYHGKFTCCFSALAIFANFAGDFILGSRVLEIFACTSMRTKYFFNAWKRGTLTSRDKSRIV